MLPRQVPTFGLPAKKMEERESRGVPSGNSGHWVCISVGAYTFLKSPTLHSFSCIYLFLAAVLFFSVWLWGAGAWDYDELDCVPVSQGP